MARLVSYDIESDDSFDDSEVVGPPPIHPFGSSLSTESLSTGSNTNYVANSTNSASAQVSSMQFFHSNWIQPPSVGVSYASAIPTVTESQSIFASNPRDAFVAKQREQEQQKLLQEQQREQEQKQQLLQQQQREQEQKRLQGQQRSQQQPPEKVVKNVLAKVIEVGKSNVILSFVTNQNGETEFIKLKNDDELNLTMSGVKSKSPIYKMKEVKGYFVFGAEVIINAKKVKGVWHVQNLGIPWLIQR